ncbi:hypothetical protein W02_05700 [Nitrospira sp. KM1]|uniref:VanZ family protein n=1 Tax=Nitrospira sp. KM1 TaxID=1936990 RepID=UPI0013A7532E|nr:VanZ family protein [Nitrospira sp. KM1]BCA53430.1 hypothetical protein W02_05700 [Nitrospira sp. KM1]
MGLISAGAYMCLLYLGAMIAPGVGFSGHLMVQVPWFVLNGAHVPAYGVLAYLLMRQLEQRSWPLSYALLTGSSAALVFGLWTEIRQGTVDGRFPSSDDLLLDATGVVIAAVILKIRAGRKQHPCPDPVVSRPSS